MEPQTTSASTGSPHASRGSTSIRDEVVEKVAGRVARDVPGVQDLGGVVARAVTAVRERMHLGQQDAAEGVSVKVDGRTAEVEVGIVIEPGFHPGEVAGAVRTTVISSLQDMLGLTISAVTVTVHRRPHSG